jgi:hypothetical protein
MSSYAVGRMPSRYSPVVEALLVHERAIIPQVEIVRARALARARAALRAGDVLPWFSAQTPAAGHRLRFAAAAGVALLASSAAAFQLMRSHAPRPPVGVHALQPLGYAQAMPAPPVAEPAPTPAAKTGTARGTPAGSTLPAKTAGPSRHASLSSKDVGTGDEVRLLEFAQQSAARGDYATVLAVATDHERRHPAGRLCEEREALRVRALVGLGRGKEARDAAARFHHDFPHSVLLPKLDEMLTSPP